MNNPQNVISETENLENFDISKPARILYQIYGNKGAFSYIDRGFINGYKSLGAEVVVWNSKMNSPDIKDILAKFKPTHFVGFLQEIAPGRPLSVWTQDEILKDLVKYKKQHGLFTAIRANPTNIEAFLQRFPVELKQLIYDIKQSFYIQNCRVNDEQKRIIDSGLIDIIRSPIYHGCYEYCFEDYLNLGLSILEEPHAADIETYQIQKPDENIDILYIGTAPEFKWANMKPYIENLKHKFSNKFKIFGPRWPDGFSNGFLNENEFDHTVCSAKINIALHEPTQVLDFIVNGNERIFKLTALKKFVISDPNPLMGYHFDIGKELVLAKNAEEMVNLTQYYLDNYDKALQIAKNGYKRTLKEHTYNVRASRLLEISNKQTYCEQIIKYK